MLKTRRREQIWFVTQPDHAQVSGYLVSSPRIPHLLGPKVSCLPQKCSAIDDQRRTACQRHKCHHPLTMSDCPGSQDDGQQNARPYEEQVEPLQRHIGVLSIQNVPARNYTVVCRTGTKRTLQRRCGIASRERAHRIDRWTRCSSHVGPRQAPAGNPALERF